MVRLEKRRRGKARECATAAEARAQRGPEAGGAAATVQLAGTHPLMLHVRLQLVGCRPIHRTAALFHLACEIEGMPPQLLLIAFFLPNFGLNFVQTFATK